MLSIWGARGQGQWGHSRAPEKSATRCDHRQLPICGWWPVSLAQFALSHVELKSGCGGLHSVQCTGVAVATQDTSNPVELRLVTQTVWAKPRRWQRVWDTIDSHLKGLETKNEYNAHYSREVASFYGQSFFRSWDDWPQIYLLLRPTLVLTCCSTQALKRTRATPRWQRWYLPFKLPSGGASWSNWEDATARRWWVANRVFDFPTFAILQ